MLQLIASLLPNSLKGLTVRFDRSPIDSVDRLAEFVHTRAAYIGQTSLYGYLKARMGTSYREHFQDKVFSASIRISAIKVFVSCLGDLAVFTVARAANGTERLTPEAAAALAQHCFESGMERTLNPEDFHHVPTDAVAAFEVRLTNTDWAKVAAEGRAAFAGSERDLVRYAPVVEQFKRLDGEIVANSIRFRWRDVREQFDKRVDGETLCASWRASRDTAGAAEDA